MNTAPTTTTPVTTAATTTTPVTTVETTTPVTTAETTTTPVTTVGTTTALSTGTNITYYLWYCFLFPMSITLWNITWRPRTVQFCYYEYIRCVPIQICIGNLDYLSLNIELAKQDNSRRQYCRLIFCDDVVFQVLPNLTVVILNRVSKSNIVLLATLVLSLQWNRTVLSHLSRVIDEGKQWVRATVAYWHVNAVVFATKMMTRKTYKTPYTCEIMWVQKGDFSLTQIAKALANLKAL